VRSLTVRGLAVVSLSLALALLAACGSQGGGSGLSGRIIVAGPSTVFPISEAVAEEFRA